ncbi:MAG TPA: flagellar motor switch protein FliN [Actinophytocola sp.]|uniref:flagellar motor switch protein FliN n=1 Tax=Actinophytocola sp. TaxID=1872138 RepID=UPI002DBDA16D|nr:flagellar motor switch protein FliN [Actinophytocola sp.]HEU5474225.1 flagellar motor switch protein FliN [Actinophytocola sp.]
MTASTLSPSAVAIPAAEAALAVLPIGENLTIGEPVTDPAAGAIDGGVTIVATLTGNTAGHLGVTVNQELVDALRTSPLGELDLATAIAPALDAVAGVLGSVAGAAQELTPDAALTAMAAAGELTVIPLTAGDEPQAAIVLSLPAPAPAPAPQPTPEAEPAVPVTAGYDLLHGVDMEITVELGRTSMTVRDLLSLSNGSVLELDRTAGSPADVLVNRRLIARGEVVVIDEYFGIRITEILASGDRDQKIA